MFRVFFKFNMGIGELNTQHNMQLGIFHASLRIEQLKRWEKLIVFLVFF